MKKLIPLLALVLTSILPLGLKAQVAPLSPPPPVSPINPIDPVSPFPASLPISGRSGLRVYALSQITQGFVSLDGGNVLPGGMTSFNVQSSDVGQIISSFSKAVFSFDVVNPSEQLNLYGGLFDSDGYSLFTDYQQVSLAQNGEGWHLPSGSLLNLKMVDYVPLKVDPSISGGQLMTRDIYGNVTGYQTIYAGGGRLFFPKEAAGNNGYLVLFANTPSGVISQAYTLTGAQLASARVKGSIGVTLKNFAQVSDLGDGVIQPALPPGAPLNVSMYPLLKQGEMATDSPVIKVVLTATREVGVYGAVIDDKLQLIEFPSGIFYQQSAGGVKTALPFVVGQYTTVTLPAGEYYFTFGYTTFEEPQPPIVMPGTTASPTAPTAVTIMPKG